MRESGTLIVSVPATASIGMPAARILADWAGGVWKGRALKAWFPGGSSAPVLTEKELDLPYDFENMAEAGSMLGTGAMIMLDESACTVRAMQAISRFYEHESCGQCSQCREGTQWLAQIFARRIDFDDLRADEAVRPGDQNAVRFL